MNNELLRTKSYEVNFISTAKTCLFYEPAKLVGAAAGALETTLLSLSETFAQYLAVVYIRTTLALADSVCAFNVCCVYICRLLLNKSPELLKFTFYRSVYMHIYLRQNVF